MSRNAIEALDALAPAQVAGRPHGIVSVCSAHPVVLRATLRRAARTGHTPLIEATCNQVNHRGGYTGMTPAAFAEEVRKLAAVEGFLDGLILGGDHLGPNPWKARPAEEALAEAETMVAAFAAAGYGKLHLDCSMACAGDPVRLDDATVATRAARLAAAAERHARESGHPPPRYIVGTEVPPPGGADHGIAEVPPTDPAAARETLRIHREVFAGAGLGEVLPRILALVVQPGVEFGDDEVHVYSAAAREAAGPLRRVLGDEEALVFEAHSTDYQPREALAALVADGFAILKVGPALTFALRQTLYGLDAIAAELGLLGEAPRLPGTMEALMRAEPGNWRGHYKAEGEALRHKLHESLLDRIRYYWTHPDAAAAVTRLFAALDGHPVPRELAARHLPILDADLVVAASPGEIAIAGVDRVLADYDAAAFGA